jgi:16S rRNA (cytosine1402-N4)-methyltransferase
MLPETLQWMDLAPGMTVVDGTVGAGGHAAAFAEAIRPGGLLVGLDRDAEILEHARGALARVRDVSVVLRSTSYAELGGALATEGVEGCDRVFLDLGVSSLQLDSPERGFSFMRDGPLDMRMDRDRARITAADWLRSVSQDELARVLYEYGGERHARRIAAAVVAARRQRPLERTGQLAELVVRALPSRARHGRLHAATRTFQAVRIAVNDEIGELGRGLRAACDHLRPGGRLCVVAFHSAEDRVVKRFLREHTELPFRKPVRPSAAEARRNPRARSARLRCGLRRSA